MPIPVLRSLLAAVASVLVLVSATVLPVGAPPTVRAVPVVAAVVLAVAAARVRPSQQRVGARPVAVVDPVGPVGRSAGSSAPTTAPVPAGPPTVTRPAAATDPRAVVVGRAEDGRAVVLDAAQGIVVTGHGALAQAVFSAIAATLGRCAGSLAPTGPEGVGPTAARSGPDGAVPTADDPLAGPVAHELRVALADDLLPHDHHALPGVVRRSGTGLTAGTGVAVLLDTTGVRVGSVVLVPDLGAAPRQGGPTVLVTRYGCSTRGDDAASTVGAFAPVLPEVVLPVAV